MRTLPDTAAPLLDLDLPRDDHAPMDELPAALKAAQIRATRAEKARKKEDSAEAIAAPRTFDLEAAEGTRRALIEHFTRLQPLIYRLPLKRPLPERLETALEAARSRLARSYELLCTQRADDDTLAHVLDHLQAALVEEARAIEAALEGDRERALDLEASARDRALKARVGGDGAGTPPESTSRAAFDRLTGRSRYDAPDPDDASELCYPLRCPRESCGEPGRHGLPPKVSTHRLRCKSCGIDFTVHVGIVAHASLARSTQAITHEVRTQDFDQTPRTLRFDETLSAHPLPIEARDLLVVIYDDDDRLCIVKNLTRGGEVWVAPRSRCFVVTAATSPLSPEVSTLRTFRDQHLIPHHLGRAAIALYESLGPGLARWILKRPSRRARARSLVQGLAATVHLLTRSPPPARPGPGAGE